MEMDWLDNYLNDEDYKFIKEYLQVFDRYCYNNKFIGLLTFLLIIGQLFKDKKIMKGDSFFDIRVHILLIQPSGSGKSEALNFVEQLCEKLGLKVISSTDYTDAGLVGGSDYDVKKTKKGKNKDKEIVGAPLQVADILSMDEASVMFKDNVPFAVNARVYFQQSMNNFESKSNRILRLMRGTKIKFNPHASVWLTTVMPKEFNNVIGTGFLERMLVNIEPEDIEKRKLNAMEDIDRIDFTKPYVEDETSEHSQRIASLANKLLQLQDYHQMMMALNVPESNRDIIKELCSEMFDSIGTIPNRIRREQLASFGTRYMTQIYKVAILLAMSRHHKEMLEKDVIFAGQIVSYCLRNLIIHLENVDDSGRPDESSRTGKINKIHNIIEEAGKSGIQSEKLRQKVVGSVCGQSTFYDILPILEKQKKIIKEQKIIEGHAYVYFRAL